MKRSTKTLVWLGSVGAGVWAWMRYGDNAARTASRVTPPGYVQQRYLVDGNGKQIALQSIYPTVAGVTKTYTVPIDPTGWGRWGALLASSPSQARTAL